MTEALFSHLTQTPLEATLPTLLTKSLERGWRVRIQGPNRDALGRLDRHLWTYDDQSFLPHAMAGGPHDAQQPILLSTDDANANNAAVLMLVDGVHPLEKDLEQYTRACVFFDGNDPDQVGATRNYWTSLKSSGLETRYWAQDNGKWVQKA